MLIYAIRPQSLPKLKHTYEACLRTAAKKSTAGQMARIKKALDQQASVQAVWQQAAEVYSAERGFPSHFTHYDHAAMSVSTMSYQGDWGSAELPASTPSTLLQFPLISRASLHLPDLRGLDRRSLAEKQLAGPDHGSIHALEITAQGDRVVQQQYSHFINGLLPLDFEPKQGALLLTPIGLERAAKMAFGFMMEYNPAQPFSPAQIQEARLLSTVFALRIAETALQQR